MHFKLKNEQVFVVADAPGGIYSPEQMKALCKLVEEDTAFLKLTEEGRVGFLTEESQLQELEKKIRALGLLVRPYQGAGLPVVRTCLGALCPFSEQDALSAGATLEQHLSHKFAKNTFAFGLGRVLVGVNGCARNCADSATSDIHIVAEETGFKICVGGKGSEMPAVGQFLAENVSAEKLPLVLSAFLQVFYENCESAEERIFETLERIGFSPFLESIEPYLETKIEENFDAAESSENLLGDVDLNQESFGDEKLDSSMESDGFTAEEVLGDGHDFESENFAEEPTDDGDKALQEEELAAESLDQFGDESEFSDSAVSEDAVSEDMVSEDMVSEDAVSEDMVSEDDLEETSALQQEEVVHAVPKMELDESGEFDVEEAEEEDFERVSSALKQENNYGSEGSLNEQEQELSEEEMRAMEHSLPHEAEEFEEKEIEPKTEMPRFEKPAESLRKSVRVKVVGEEIHLQLPGGLECAIPLDSLQGNDAIELELEDGRLLVLENKGNTLEVNYSGTKMTFPLRKLAA
jgi:dissimilatory sulfite reductase (desulfoviridin) alpha/beta subunit